MTGSQASSSDISLTDQTFGHTSHADHTGHTVHTSHMDHTGHTVQTGHILGSLILLVSKSGDKNEMSRI